MRYIDLSQLLAEPGVPALVAAAEQAGQEMRNAPDAAAREALMKAGRGKWVAFRPHLERVFGRKCWYTESENPGTDDDIDHYRPKGAVAEDPAHGGYWWEAFNWRNLRLSCHRANRLRENPETGATHGKGEHFPLLREDDRCRDPDDDVDRERPALLDPTTPDDPPLLTFDQDGRVALSPPYKDDPDAARRVDDSRIYLHLEWPALVEQRQRLYALVSEKVHDGDRAYARFGRNEPGAKERLREVARDLIGLANERRSFSRAAVAYIYKFRDREWLKHFVLPSIPPACMP